MIKTDCFLNQNKNYNFLSSEYSVFVSRSSIDYHKTLSAYKPTPLIKLNGLAEKLGVKEIFVKDESKRFGLNAFKCLGASYAINEYLKKNKGEFTFCTATDGNHGRAVAWASKIFNQKAVVFVPYHTVETRISTIKNEGAEVIVVNGDYDKTVEEAKEQSIKNGWILIQDSSWQSYTDVPMNIMRGYLTMFYELEEQFHKNDEPKVDFIFLQAGVGSWAASAVVYYLNKHKTNLPKLILVEPYEADCVLESVKRGQISTSTKSQKTIMAGLNCGTPSLIAFNILKNGIDLFISIPDKYSEEAMRQFYYSEKDDPQIFSGESGAAGLAGLLALLNDKDLEEVKKLIGMNKESGILLFNTEGDTDPVNFKNILNLQQNIL
jgi:diaminopropionate ammonia-lyase